MANATLLDFLFHRFVMKRKHFTYSYFAWGLHGDVDLKWSGGLLVFWSFIDAIVVRLKSACAIFPMGIDSAESGH